jgi:hypothetical protein
MFVYNLKCRPVYYYYDYDFYILITCMCSQSQKVCMHNSSYILKGSSLKVCNTYLLLYRELHIATAV